MAQGEVGLKSEMMDLPGGNFEFVGGSEGEGELSFPGVGFDFDLRWFGVREV